MSFCTLFFFYRDIVILSIVMIVIKDWRLMKIVQNRDI